MMYGELAKKDASYQNGHSTGSTRALDSAIYCFEHCINKQKFTTREVVEILKIHKAEWLKHCETYGMGISEVDEDDEDDAMELLASIGVPFGSDGSPLGISGKDY